MQPKHRCNRCRESFETHHALIFHQRRLEPCPLVAWDAAEGCDEEQKDKIRKGDKGDENTRWKRMFHILFPDIENPPDGFVYENDYYVAPPPAFDQALWEEGLVAGRVAADVASGHDLSETHTTI